MYNKFIVGLAVIALGVVAGWYVMGGKGSIPAFPTVQNTTPGNATLTPAPTLQETSLYDYRNQTVTTTVGPTTTSTKGGLPASTISPTPSVKILGIKVNVSYTDSGFSPMVQTVKIGTTLVFTNNSSKNMWVASAVHPTHKELPGFDQLKSVARGGTYEYTFVKIGSWKYHNHLSPDHTGVVIVTR